MNGNGNGTPGRPARARKPAYVVGVPDVFSACAWIRRQRRAVTPKALAIGVSWVTDPGHAVAVLRAIVEAGRGVVVSMWIDGRHCEAVSCDLKAEPPTIAPPWSEIGRPGRPRKAKAVTT